MVDPLEVEDVVPNAKLGINQKGGKVKAIIGGVVLLALAASGFYVYEQKTKRSASPFGNQLPADYSPITPVNVSNGSGDEPAAPVVEQAALPVPITAATPAGTVDQPPAVSVTNVQAPAIPVMPVTQAVQQAPAVAPLQNQTLIQPQVIAQAQPTVAPAPAPVVHTPQVTPQPPFVETPVVKPVSHERKKAIKRKVVSKQKTEAATNAPVEAEKPVVQSAEAAMREMITTEEVLLIQ